ncbi:MAG: hypothetical protein KDA28_02630, partial [Phycisphaerales bacterium]|nr:hypothetical protein [Phycisphaerales bacterium]
MAGKDKEKIDDLEADFFGDEDLDWLDDDDSEVVEKRKARAQLDVDQSGRGALPVAPPPPPIFSGESGTVVPRDQKEAEWAKKVTNAPLDPAQLSRAKTLVFSQVPTL